MSFQIISASTSGPKRKFSSFLQDIDEEFDVSDRREYFTGTVLVSPTTQTGHFELIDGQQRLTTFFLLLCALRQRFKGEPHELTCQPLGRRRALRDPCPGDATSESVAVLVAVKCSAKMRS